MLGTSPGAELATPATHSHRPGWGGKPFPEAFWLTHPNPVSAEQPRAGSCPGAPCLCLGQT